MRFYVDRRYRYELIEAYLRGLESDRSNNISNNTDEYNDYQKDYEGWTKEEFEENGISLK